MCDHPFARVLGELADLFLQLAHEEDHTGIDLPSGCPHQIGVRRTSRLTAGKAVVERASLSFRLTGATDRIERQVPAITSVFIGTHRVDGRSAASATACASRKSFLWDERRPPFLFRGENR